MLSLKEFSAKSIEEQKAYKKTKWFKQNAFTDLELKLQPMISTLIGLLLAYFEAPFVHSFIHHNVWAGSGIGWNVLCTIVSFWTFIACIFQAISLKLAFYNIIGKLMGLQTLSPHDEFWLYDFPIMPVN